MVRRASQRRWRSAASRRLLQMSGAGTVDTAVEKLAGALVPCNAPIPIEPEEFFDRYRIVDAVSDSTLPYAGKLEQTAGGFRIRYAANMRATRRRFTLAHELCHAVFAATGPGWPRAGLELEDICEMFAAALLMPRWAVDNEWNPGTRSFDTFTSCARTFDVSLTALALRLTQLGLAVVVHESEGVWAPVAHTLRIPDLHLLMSHVNGSDRTFLCPDIFHAVSSVRCIVGPEWRAGRYALLLPVQAGSDQPPIAPQALEEGLAVVRRAIARGLHQHEGVHGESARPEGA